MMAGAYAYCYGAHGVWNAGDGKFWAHWGKQTLGEAMRLRSPQLIGASHKLFIESGFADYPKVEIEEKDGELVKITRSNSKGSMVTYIPDASLIDDLPEGNIFSPLKGEILKTSPRTGQIVIISL